MLGGLIECAVWHKHWTNVTYSDRPFILAFLLDWHARSLPNNARFTGENLYSLLFMAKYSIFLVPFDATTAEADASLTPELFHYKYDPHGVHAFLKRAGNQLLRRLPSDEQSLFCSLEATFKAHLLNEYAALFRVIKDD